MSSSDTAVAARPMEADLIGAFPPGAELLLLSGPPTKAEAGAGRPFVGRSGHHLDFLLADAGLMRKREVATLSVIGYRPAEEAPRTWAEVDASRPAVLRQIEVVDPLLIVVLGEAAAAWALGRGTALSGVRGHLHQFGPRPLIPSHAPADAIHCGSRGAPAIQLEADLRYAVALLPRLRELRAGARR